MRILSFLKRCTWSINGKLTDSLQVYYRRSICVGQAFRIGVNLLFPSTAPHFPESRWFPRGASAWKCGALSLFEEMAPHLRRRIKPAAASQVSSNPSGSAPACFFLQLRRIFRSGGGFKGEYLPGNAAQILCSGDWRRIRAAEASLLRPARSRRSLLDRRQLAFSLSCAAFSGVEVVSKGKSCQEMRRGFSVQIVHSFSGEIMESFVIFRKRS